MPALPVPSDQFVRYSSTLTIEELTATGDGSPRKVVLRGAGMPFMGADWGGKNKLITTFYAGNPIGSQQLLGPEEVPSNWQGEWNRTLLSRTPALVTDETGSESQVVTPMTLVEVVEDMLRKGAMLRVTWANHGSEVAGNDEAGQTLRLVNFNVVRDGRASDWKFNVDRPTDLKWQINFAWVGRGGQQKVTADVRGDTDVQAAASALDTQLSIMRSIARATMYANNANLRLSASTFTLGQLEQFADYPRKLVEDFTRRLQVVVNDFKKAGDIAKKFRAAPFAIANTAVDFARNTLSICNQFVDEMGRQCPEQISLSRKTRDVLRLWNYATQIREQAQQLARASQVVMDKSARYQSQASGQPVLTALESSSTRKGRVIGVYRTKTGDTPQSVSFRWYNTPDRALDILQANRLPWQTTTFDMGQLLVIPAIDTVARL